jgi:predicted AAA+ superfamily ATPase
MLIQSWLSGPSWIDHEPKMHQLRLQPLVLGHTAALANRIPLSPPGIIFVRGPRQCGKSTFLRQFIVKAIGDGFPSSNIGLIEAEACNDRHELLGIIQNFVEPIQGPSLILIDEITSIEKWWLALKIALIRALQIKSQRVTANKFECLI